MPYRNPYSALGFGPGYGSGSVPNPPPVIDLTPNPLTNATQPQPPGPPDVGLYRQTSPVPPTAAVPQTLHSSRTLRFSPEQEYAMRYRRFLTENPANRFKVR